MDILHSAGRDRRFETSLRRPAAPPPAASGESTRGTGVARLLFALCVIAAIFTALDLAALDADVAAPAQVGEPR